MTTYSLKDQGANLFYFSGQSGGLPRDMRELPNCEEVMDPQRALELISYSHSQGSVCAKPTNNYARWGTLFTRSTPMGGRNSWNGEGYFLQSYPVKLFSFYLCKHEKTEEGHSPNHIRGWHPGHCKLCGMDMTVDSGD